MRKQRILATDSRGAYQRNDFSEPRLFHLPIHRKALNFWTWYIWLFLINNNLWKFQLSGLCCKNSYISWLLHISLEQSLKKYEIFCPWLKSSVMFYKYWSVHLSPPPVRIVFCCCCSVTQSCPTLCDHVDCSTPGFPVLHYLLELAQTHVHWLSDAIQLPHLLSSPPAFNLS